MKKSGILIKTLLFVVIWGNTLCQPKQFESGKAAYNNGEFKKSIPYFIECTKIDPQNNHYYFGWLGEAYYYNRQFNEAIESLNKAINLNPDPPYKCFCWRFIAWSYEMLGQFDLAILSIMKTIDIEPDSTKNFVTLSILYRKNKQFDQAIIASKMALKLKPDNSKAYYELGIDYYLNMQNDEAINSLKKSIGIYPKNANAHNLMGYIFTEKNDYNNALLAYKKAMEVAPTNPSIYIAIARVYYIIADNDEALLAINKSLELLSYEGIGIYHDFKDNYPVVTALNNLGPAKKADLKVGDKIIVINGENTYGWNDKQLISIISGSVGTKIIMTIERSEIKIEKAIIQEKIIPIDAASSLAYRSLIYRQKGNYKEALINAEMALSLDSSNYLSQLSLGAAYLDKGQYFESIKLLSKIKDNTSSRLLEAIAYTKVGKINEAIKIYLSIPDEDLSSKNVLLMNDYMGLIQIFKPMVKKHRDKAVFFESKGKHKEALSELTEAKKIANDTVAQKILEQMFQIIRKNPILSVVPEEIQKYDVRARLLIKEGNIEQASLEYSKAIKNAPYISKLYLNAALINAQLKKYPEAISYMKIYINADPDVPNSKAAIEMIIKWQIMLADQI